jgi:hypothetical protein
MTAALQLDLLRGPRQRGRRPPPAKEFATHCAIADTIRIGIAPGWLWFHPPNGGERPAFTNKHGKRISPEGGRLQRMGAKPGASDFILAGPPYGRIHALELKRRGEKPTEAQYAFLDDVRAAGGLAAWVDNYAAAIDQLQGWGALRVKIEVAA